MSETIVYLVKFQDDIYYTKEAPNYDWTYDWFFTKEPILAYQYKTHEEAVKRGELGVAYSKSYKNKPFMKSYVIEEWLIKTTMEKVE